MSIINDIEIKNFKSIRHQKIEGCKRINVFVGEPNVGKSNILEAMSLMCFANERFLNLKNVCRYGSLSDIYNDGDSQKDVEIRTNSLTYSLKYISESILDYSVKDSTTIIMESLNSNMPFLSLRFDNEGMIGNFSSGFKEITYSNVKKYEYKNSVLNSSSSAKNLEIPYGENLSLVIKNNKYIRKQCGELFAKYNLKLVFDNDNKMLIQKSLDDYSIFQISPFQIADTLHRLIFYLTAIGASEKSILLLEEPEANCYEPYIMEMTNAIKNDKNENQFFIVTHSQYVIDELMRDEESRNDTNIYLVGLENNETKVKLLSAEASKDAYQTGLNLFFNYQTLWDEN
jgi:AAA15 family ATPase/GTPase